MNDSYHCREDVCVIFCWFRIFLKQRWCQTWYPPDIIVINILIQKEKGLKLTVYAIISPTSLGQYIFWRPAILKAARQRQVGVLEQLLSCWVQLHFGAAPQLITIANTCCAFCSCNFCKLSSRHAFQSACTSSEV